MTGRSLGNVAGKAIISLIGIAIVAGAAGLVWYIFWAQLTSVVAILGALACALMFGFLGLTLTVAPWRQKTGDAAGEGMQG